MSKTEAYKYLAETVANYVGNGFPLEHLTGEEGTIGGGTRPDLFHVDQLVGALITLGFHREAEKIDLS